MAEEENVNSKNQLEFSTQGDFSYLMFLILILLFMGNGSTFTAYFKEFDNEIQYINKLFHTMSATAEGLKNAFETPQKVAQDLNFNNDI